MAPGFFGGLFSDVFGGGGDGTPTSTAAGGILPTLSLPLSLPGVLPTLSLLPTPSAPLAPSVPIGAPPVAPTSLSAPPTSLSLPLPSSTPAPPTASSASSPAALSTPLPDVSAGGNGAVQTVSKVVTVSASQSSAAASRPAHHTSFLQNKPLAGAVFALVGIVALVLIFIGATFFIRRQRRSRLLDDAVSFDPGLIAAAERSEKGHTSNASMGTTGSGRAAGYGAYSAPSVQHNEYYGQQYGMQPEYYQGGQRTDYYGGTRQTEFGYVPPMADARQTEFAYVPDARQTEFAYVPPMTDAPAPSLAGTSWASAPPPQQQKRLPPRPEPLPEEFGQDGRTSMEEAEFWARTLTVRNE